MKTPFSQKPSCFVIFFLIIAFIFGFYLHSDATPVELGRVQWYRNLSEAVPLAKKSNKPIFILFQEVPGCITCQTYGHKVLSHPLLVEAIESLFIPVAIFNNRGGDDAKTLRQFGEPAWNNPVVRIVDANERNIVERLSGDYSTQGLVNNMVTALQKTHHPVPKYLSLLQEEFNTPQHALEKSVFSMYCFWSGEAALGAIKGVISTKTGFLERHEVVEVTFDPTTIPYKKLAQTARKNQISSRFFTRNKNQQKIAKKITDGISTLSTQAIKPDSQPKYYLSHTPLKYVPMTLLQGARINSAAAYKQDTNQFLSPRQIELLEIIIQNPDVEWIDLINTEDLTSIWERTFTTAKEFISP